MVSYIGGNANFWYICCLLSSLNLILSDVIFIYIGIIANYTHKLAIHYPGCLCQLFQKPFIIIVERRGSQGVLSRGNSTSIQYNLVWESLSRDYEPKGISTTPLTTPDSTSGWSQHSNSVLQLMHKIDFSSNKITDFVQSYTQTENESESKACIRYINISFVKLLFLLRRDKYL